MRKSFLLSIGFISALVSGAFAESELSLQMAPKLTLTGPSGSYQIQRAQVLGTTTNWTVVTNVYLFSTNYVFYDDAAIGAGQQFYRAVEQTPDQINPYPQRLVWIRPGTFAMGSPATEEDRHTNEGPQTLVTLTKGFFIGKYELTQIEYTAVMGTNPSVFVALYAPVENVSWNDAVEFCTRLTALDKAEGRLPAGFEYRLPTEAEWECACRAGTTTRFSYGDDPGYTNLTNYAWYSDNSGDMPHPVGQKLPNLRGLYDMHGNVWEWCLDWWSNNLLGGIVVDPKGPNSGTDRVIHGGSWSNNGRNCRSAYRGYISAISPAYRYNALGFRVVLAPGP
jgi:formylglycine-generating enzyme required for sulfatase activity